MLGIEKELAVFVSACLTGNLICLTYFSIRVFRRIVPHGIVWISIEDLVFWIGCGLYLFGEMYRTCQGNIRWYFVLGVLSGGLGTLLLTGKIKKYIDKKRKTM